MSSRIMAVAGRFVIALGMVLAMGTAFLGYAISPVALADDGEPAVAEAPSLGDDIRPSRTIMIYLDGASSEAKTRCAPPCSRNTWRRSSIAAISALSS